MKIFRLYFILTIMALAGFTACGQTNAALRQWTVTVKVLGDDGNPIQNAKTWVAYYLPSQDYEANPGRLAWDKVQGLTDANGTLIASHADTRSISLGIHVEKDGYYPSYRNHEFAKFEDPDPGKGIQA